MTVTSETAARTSGRRSSWTVEEALRLKQETNPTTGKVWTNADLAELYGVRVQAIGQRLNRATGGATKGGSQPETRCMPWTIAERHKIFYVPRMLRLLDRRERGDTLPAEKAAQLDNFLLGLRRLGDFVIYYDREDQRGFILRPRRREDGNRLCVTDP